MKKLLKAQVAAVAAATCMMCGGIAAAQGNQATQLDAQTIEYNAQTGQITANGGVTMLHDGATLTGAYATYNSKTQQGTISGGVHGSKGGMQFSSQSVTTQGKDEIVASGGVYAKQADKSLRGPALRYNFSTEYAVLPQGGTISMADGTITANHLEGNLQNEQFQAAGNVHIVSQTRNIDAYSDKADYYGKQDAKVILSGHAVAMQDNNELRGERLTLYLGDDGKAAVK